MLPEITSEVKGPLYFYYELNKFYANHRRFHKSKVPDQYKGNYLKIEELEECEPVVTIGDLYPH